MTIRIRWAGTEFAARIVKGLENGRTLVEALEHGPRFTIGTQLEVKDHEIILPFDTSTPPTPNEPAAMEAAMNAEVTVAPAADALQAAMDAERKTLPTVAEVLANPNPTPPLSASSSPAAAPITTENQTMSSRLSEKLKLVASAGAELTAEIEQNADDFLARRDALRKRQGEVFSMHKQILSDAETGLDAVEAGLRQFSNSLPGQAS